MSLSIVNTRAKLGLKAPLVSVEVHLSNGLPAFNIVGLPEAAVKESKDRVRSAILNSKFEFPNRRITVNLAPAELPKGGSRFDLAIAIGILAASDQVPKQALFKLRVYWRACIIRRAARGGGSLALRYGLRRCEKTAHH